MEKNEGISDNNKKNELEDAEKKKLQAKAEKAAKRDARAQEGNCDDLLEAWEEAARKDAAEEAAAKAGKPGDSQGNDIETAGEKVKQEDSNYHARKVPILCNSKKSKPVIILASPADRRKSTADPTSEFACKSNAEAAAAHTPAPHR